MNLMTGSTFKTFSVPKEEVLFGKFLPENGILKENLKIKRL